MSYEVTDRPAGRRPEGSSRGGASAPARRRSGQRKPEPPRKKAAPRKRPLRQKKKRKKAKARNRVAFGKIFGRKFVRALTISAVSALLLIVCLMVVLRIDYVSVVGNSLYSKEEIQEATGLSEGSALLLVNKTAVASRIKAELPYVDDVRVGIGLPDTVKIEVVELESVYAVAADDGSYWLVNSEGRLVEQITAKEASEYLTIEGVRLQNAVAGQAYEVVEDPLPKEEAPTEEQTDDDTELDVPPEATAAERMDIALQILRQLEDSEDIRTITALDVTSKYHLEIWYGTQFQVVLGDPSEMSYKLEYMLAAIDQLESSQSGVLDLTFEEAKKATFIPWTN